MNTKNKKSVIYFGSPSFSAEVLRGIFLGQDSLEADIALVVTQADMPAGRGLKNKMTAVKALAIELGIDVFEFNRSQIDSLVERIKNISNPFGILFAFNEMIPDKVLNLFPDGLWNIHPSLLPKYRGASPIAYPLILGDRCVGISIIKMTKFLDAGDILAQSVMNVESTDTHEVLIQKLSNAGLQLTIKLLHQDDLKSTAQNHSLATFTRKLNKDDGYIKREALQTWASGGMVEMKDIRIIDDYYERNKTIYTPGEYLGPEYLFYLFRGLHPWPGLWTKIERLGSELRVKILKVRLLGGRPIIETVQLEGKRSVDYKTFVNAYGAF